MSDKKIEEMFELEGVEGYEGIVEDGEEFEVDSLTLTNEDGEEKEFIIADVIEQGEKQYLIFVSVDEDEDDGSHEVAVFEGVEDPDDPEALELEAIEDEKKIEELISLFAERNSEEYDFE